MLRTVVIDLLLLYLTHYLDLLLPREVRDVVSSTTTSM